MSHESPATPSADPLAAHLDAVRAAFAADATDDTRAGGLHSLRTLYVQLAANRAASALTAPTRRAPAGHPLRSLTIDQALDLVVAQLAARVDGGAEPTAAGATL